MHHFQIHSTNRLRSWLITGLWEERALSGNARRRLVPRAEQEFIQRMDSTLLQLVLAGTMDPIELEARITH